MAANVARHDEIGPGLVLYTCLLSTACPRSTPNSLFSSPLRVGVTMQIRPPPRTAPRIPSLSAPWRPRERNRRTSILARPAGGGGGISRAGEASQAAQAGDKAVSLGIGGLSGCRRSARGTYQFR
ncbi:hypothetical protein VDGL01_07702 [Verticillium dahliae]